MSFFKYTASFLIGVYVGQKFPGLPPIGTACEALLIEVTKEIKRINTLSTSDEQPTTPPTAYTPPPPKSTKGWW